MSKIHVHDFSFNYIDLKERISENDFFCSVRIHYNFSPEDPGPGWDELEYFFVFVATPDGFANYIKRNINSGSYPKKLFFPNLLIFDNNDEDEIMDFIKTELHSINGKTEKELVLKAIRKFGWENETIPEVYNMLFK